MRRSQQTLWLFILLAASVGPVRADMSAVLHLGDKDFLSGELQDSDATDSLRWQSTVATGPFDFPVERISAVHFPPQEKPQIPAGDYALELSGGDRLFGELIGITADKIEFDAAPFGKLQIDRNQVVRIIRRNAVRDWVYMGPNGLAGWKQPGDAANWREEAGHLISEVPHATVLHDCAIPEQACIEFEISWKKKPDFVFTLGANLESRPDQTINIRQAALGFAPAQSAKKPKTTGYRFEVWDKSLVIVSERGHEADVAAVTNLEAEGRLHLRAYLDQKTGRFSVYSLDGKQLAQIEVPPSEPIVGIELRNKTGDIRLEQLSISSWDGRLPVEVSLDEAYVLRTDGIVLDCKVTAFDSGAKQFVVATVDGEQQIDVGNIATVLISPKPEPPTGPLRAVLHSGVSVTGSLANVRDGKLQLSRSGIEETLAVPVTAVRSLLGPGKLNLTPPEGIRVGRLELEGVRSHGWLIDGTGNADGSCLVWHPRQGASSSPLLAGLSGRLVYRDPPPPKPKLTSTQIQQQQQQQARPGVWGGVLDAFGVRKNPQPKPAAQPVAKQSLLHLRAGDNVPCQVTSVDEEGVHIASAVVEAKFIPHEQIKAIELATGVTLPEIDEKKRQRLLTLPRMQRNNPPTHLLIGTNGDILRGRLQEMSEETVAVEIHLETRDLPREQVASIIWLHKAELADDPAEKTASEKSGALAQALRPDGIRLTFTPHEVIDNALVGTSDILGACRVDLQTVDMLLLGSAIQAATDEQEYHTWKLTHAADPKYLNEDATAAGPGPAVTTSGLIGQPAPEVKLKLASGKPFLLSKEKGHVVVLDFWASWCGPCMQAMPMVDEVVKEFEAKGVKLVAVNMQEDEETVKSALERLKLDSTVALDIDGATAEKYQVTAIPQTVIIDAEGKVAKLFVGGGSQLGEQLRQALQELTNPSEPAATEVTQ